jgi:hypothetical protein
MGSEPKKPIEQMLEAMAKARRAQFGSDPKMPNPMRVRLHEEIARAGVQEDEEVESRPSWITMFWPRVTVAAALATLLVLVPAIWWNQSHPAGESRGLAFRDRNSAASDALNPAMPAKETLGNPSAAGASEATIDLADNNEVKMKPGTTPSSESEALKSSSEVAQRRGATDLPAQHTKEFDHQITGAKIQGAPAAAPPVAQQSSTGKLATTGQFSQQPGGQSFRNNAQAVGANVLNTFQVQQEGNDIRVVDADGSTYTGKIEEPARNAEMDSRAVARQDAAKQTQRYAAKAVSEKKSTARQSYFRATGYNLTLKRSVVFEGNYELPGPQQPTFATSKDKEQAEQRGDRARIVGTARVNGEPPVAVDAIAETPDPAAPKKSDK